MSFDVRSMCSTIFSLPPYFEFSKNLCAHFFVRRLTWKSALSQPPPPPASLSLRLFPGGRIYLPRSTNKHVSDQRDVPRGEGF